jgi:hypothetical protein
MEADKPTDITIGEALEKIRTGAWKPPVERVRRKHGKAYNAAVIHGDPDPAAAAKKAVLGGQEEASSVNGEREISNAL